MEEQDKSSDINEQPPFGDSKYSNTLSQMREEVQNQREHFNILTKNVAVHPTVVSENYSSFGMLTILIKAKTLSIYGNIFDDNFTYIMSKRTKK